MFGRRLVKSRRFQGANKRPINNPIDIFGNALQVWYRSDLGIVLNGSTVAQWIDQSGNNDTNRTLANPVASQQPLYIASDPAFGGKPSLQFDGVDDWLYTGNYLGDGAYTVFEVCTGLIAASAYFWTRGGISYDYLRGDNSPSFWSLYSAVRGGSGASGYTHTNATWGMFSGTKTIRVEMDGTHTGHNGFLNNGAAEFTVTQASGNPGTNQHNTFLTIGADGSGANVAGNKVAEFLMVTGVDSTKNQQCEQYLLARYGHY
jgi:hypothetical protein